MALVRMDIQSIVVGGGPMASLVVLRTRHGNDATPVQLPIRIGTFEAAAISMGVEGRPHKRPMTHDLLNSVIRDLGGTLTSVIISRVCGTTFYAQLQITTATGESLSIDSRPSDAIALAVRSHKPIFADAQVLETATLPDFDGVERNEREREVEAFHSFVENLSPDDFAE